MYTMYYTSQSIKRYFNILKSSCQQFLQHYGLYCHCSLCLGHIIEDGLPTQVSWLRRELPLPHVCSAISPRLQPRQHPHQSLFWKWIAWNRLQFAFWVLHLPMSVQYPLVCDLFCNPFLEIDHFTPPSFASAGDGSTSKGLTLQCVRLSATAYFKRNAPLKMDDFT